MKLVKIAKQKNMLAFDYDGNGQKTWCNCSPKVLEFVKNNFQEGDNVDVTFSDEEKDGMKYATLVKKGTGQSSSQTSSSSSKPTCADCGIELKDSKYKKCFTCNKKSPAKAFTPSSSNNTELIKREAVAHATSRVMIGLQAHIDPNNVVGMFTTVYNHILKLVEGK